MALLKNLEVVGRCPRCGSRDVIVEYRKIHDSKQSLITKKWVKCKKCGYES